MSIQEIESVIAKLSLIERAALASWIVRTLEGLSDAECDALWAEEAEALRFPPKMRFRGRALLTREARYLPSAGACGIDRSGRVLRGPFTGIGRRARRILIG